MLTVTDAVVRYGSIEALHGISFNVEQGRDRHAAGGQRRGKIDHAAHALGAARPSSGSIIYEGHDITKIKAHEFVSMGISHVPEGRRVFPRMTVEENLEMGAFRRSGPLRDDMEEIYTQFPILKERRKQPGANLSGGEQQMLAIGRALMSKPRLLLLDEPSMGLAPMIVETIFSIIGRSVTPGRRSSWWNRTPPGPTPRRPGLRHGKRSHRLWRQRRTSCTTSACAPSTWAKRSRPSDRTPLATFGTRPKEGRCECEAVQSCWRDFADVLSAGVIRGVCSTVPPVPARPSRRCITGLRVTPSVGLHRGPDLG
jgi:branched-chain amino acid transport system ATP-binding protein